MPRDGQFMGAGCHVGARWDRAGAATKVGTGLGPVVFWGGWWQGWGPVLGPWAAGSGPSVAGLCHERGSPSSSLCPGESRGLSSSRDARSSFAPITECPQLWGPGASPMPWCKGERGDRPPSITHSHPSDACKGASTSSRLPNTIKRLRGVYPCQEKTLLNWI